MFASSDRSETGVDFDALADAVDELAGEVAVAEFRPANDER